MADIKDKKNVESNLPKKKYLLLKFAFRLFLIVVILGAAYSFWINPNFMTKLSEQSKKIFAVNESEIVPQQPDQTQILQQEVADLRQQVALLQKLQNQQTDTSALEKRFETLEAFNKNVINSKADVAIVLGLLARLDKAEQKLDLFSKITDQSAIALTATMLIKDAAENGGSFVYEAEILRQLAADNQDVKAPLDIVLKTAVEGVANKTYLVTSFDKIYGQLYQQYQQQNQKTWKDKLNKKLSEYIKVQKAGEKSVQDENEQILNQVFDLVNSGNIKQALLNLSKLSDPALQNDASLKAWIEKAQAKTTFDNALSQIATYYLAALKVNSVKKEIQHD